jgi:type IV pilus assembly protein PilW
MNHTVAVKEPRNTSVHFGEQRGATLIEVMAGVVVTLVVVAAGYITLNTTSKATRANDQTVDTQQNARVAMELIARDIKLAGYGMVGQVGGCALGGTPAAIVPSDNNPTGADSGPDSISMVVPITSPGAPYWTLANVVGPGFSQLTLQAGAVPNMVTEGLNVGSSTTAQVSINGTVTATVSNVAGNMLVLSSNIPAPATFPAGTPVYFLQCVRYSIGANAAACPGANAPCLLRNGQPIVDGIEDIQFAYACDGCNTAVNGGIADSIADDQNASGSFDQADFMTNNTWTVSPLTPEKIRLVQITVVARQTIADQGSGEARVPMTATAAPLVVSDHNHSSDTTYNASTYPQFRRRVLTRTIETRNLGL